MITCLLPATVVALSAVLGTEEAHFSHLAHGLDQMVVITLGARDGAPDHNHQDSRGFVGVALVSAAITTATSSHDGRLRYEGPSRV